MSDECPFCELIRNEEYERKYHDLPDDGRVLPNVVFEPLEPVVPGHKLVVPVHHVTDAGQHPRITASTMMVASVLAAEVGDCNIITSKGAAATQTVKHLHLHVVPRHEGDGLRLPWRRR